MCLRNIILNEKPHLSKILSLIPEKFHEKCIAVFKFLLLHQILKPKLIDEKSMKLVKFDPSHKKIQVIKFQEVFL